MIQKYQTTLAVVAFIDILGSSEAIRTNANESLNTIHTAYDEALIEFEKFYSEYLCEPKVDIFSDNIILSIEVTEGDEKKAFLSIMFFGALLQMHMWINGLLVRGGISCGDFFSDEKMIWGNALLTAHALENQIAIYPRIILEPKMAEALLPTMSSAESHILCKDFDGIYFVDPFGTKRKVNGLYLLEKFIDDNVVRLKENQNDLKKYQKINWLHQYFMEKHREMTDTHE